MCALCQLEGHVRVEAAARLAWLWYGEGYKKGAGVWFTSGSRAEGLAVEEHWGHKSTDRDRMKLHGGPLGVHVSQAEKPAGAATLAYSPEECPEAYCKLKVKNPQRLEQHLKKVGHSGSTKFVSKCIVNHHFGKWLHIRNLLHVLLPKHRENVSGPAGNKYGGDWDMVPALICSAPHPDIESFCQKRSKRSWPTSQQLAAFITFPMLLVLTGFKSSPQFHLEARVSWSHLELILLACLPMWIKQGYVAFKYTFKGMLSSFRDKNELPEEGRSVVSSYNLKTTLFYHLVDNPPQPDGCPFRLVMDLLGRLQAFLEDRKQPHFFMPECDLLKTVGDKEYEYALRAVQLFKKDPVQAILASPVAPNEIYGDVGSDHLLSVFHKLSTYPNKQSLEGVRDVFQRLENHRKQRYKAQLEQDQMKNVTQRPGPELLVEKLSLIKPL